MEKQFDDLIDRFEAGAISRRDLAKSLLALGSAAVIGNVIAGRSTVGAAVTLTDWQFALLGGIANAHFTYTDGVVELTGEPYDDGDKHRQWLFEGYDGDPALRSNDIGDIRTAIQNVPREDGDDEPREDPGHWRARDVRQLFGNARDLGASDTALTLYKVLKEKIKHAGDHGWSEGALDMAGHVYNAVKGDSTDCAEKIVTQGAVLYGESTDDFRELIKARPGGVTSHNY
jgi:hypothetical protein